MYLLSIGKRPSPDGKIEIYTAHFEPPLKLGSTGNSHAHVVIPIVAQTYLGDDEGNLWVAAISSYSGLDSLFPWIRIYHDLIVDGGSQVQILMKQELHPDDRDLIGKVLDDILEPEERSDFIAEPPF